MKATFIVILLATLVAIGVLPTGSIKNFSLVWFCTFFGLVFAYKITTDTTAACTGSESFNCGLKCGKFSIPKEVIVGVILLRIQTFLLNQKAQIQIVNFIIQISIIGAQGCKASSCNSASDCKCSNCT